MAQNIDSNPNKIARQERKNEKRKARLAKAVAREDEKLKISVGETPNAQETKTNESTPNKSFTKFIDATGNPQTEKVVSNTPEEEIVVGEQTSTTTPSYNPGQALTSIMSMAPITGGNVFANVIRANPNMSFNEMKDVAEKTAMVDDAKEEVTQEKQAVVNALGNEMVQQQNVQGQTPPTAGGMGGATTDVSGITTTGGAPSTGPATSNIGEVVTSKEPTRPSYQETVTQEQLARDLAQASSELDFITPDAVMEKLQLTDYYPNAGRDIAVGNWTGSVLGSQTIYSGAGGLLPMGLYDARKRAIANAAKQKQAIIDKFLELPDTADQFQKNYKEYGFNTLINDGLKQYGSYEKMIKSPEWRQKYARFKNTGIELMYYDKQADKVIKDLSDGTRYVPKQMRELAYKVKQGLTDDIENILSGKSNFLKEAGGFRSYENGTAHVDALVKNGIFNKDRLSEMPINLKTAEAEANPKEYSDFVRSLNEGSRDNDTFVTQFKRFYDVSNAEKLIDSLYRDNNFDPSTKQSTLDYFLAQIPNQVVNEYKTMGNSKVQWAKLAQDDRHWQKEYERKVQEGKGYYEILDASMNEPFRDGKNIKTRLSDVAINTKGKSNNDKRNAIKNAYIENGFTPVWDKHTKTFSRQTLPSTKMQKTSMPSASNLTKINFQEYSVKNKRWEDRSLTVREFAAKEKQAKSGWLRTTSGVKYTKEDMEAFKSASRNNLLNVNPQVLETSAGFVEDNGNLVYVREDNVDRYEASKARNIHRVKGSASVKGKPIMDPENPNKQLVKDGIPQYEEVPLKGEFYVESDISNSESQKTLNTIFGKEGTYLWRDSDEPYMTESGSSSGGR